MEKALLFVFTVLVSTPIPAVIPKLAGVWHGTIGQYPITVCFNPPRDTGMQCGNYYYHRYLSTIPLTIYGPNPECHEPYQEGKWFFDSVTTDKAYGRWSNSKSKRPLPIYLTKVKSDSKGDTLPCGCDSFHAEIEIHPLVNKTRKIFSGKYYNQLFLKCDYMEVKTLQIPGSKPGIDAVNRIFKRVFTRLRY